MEKSSYIKKIVKAPFTFTKNETILLLANNHLPCSRDASKKSTIFQKFSKAHFTFIEHEKILHLTNNHLFCSRIVRTKTTIFKRCEYKKWPYAAQCPQDRGTLRL